MNPKPFSTEGFYIVPFQAEGVTASGIEVIHDKRLPPIYGRVTAVHESCTRVRVGDWVIYLQGRPARLRYPGGVVFALTESDLLGVMEPGDGDVWFRENAA